jgi:hypothetical protein
VSKGGSMTVDLLQQYVDNIVAKRPGALFSAPGLLILDSATCHDTAKLKLDKSLNVVKVIRVHCNCPTSFLQLLAYAQFQYQDII